MRISTKYLFWGILFSGVILRFWQLGTIPQGFYSDEALYGYEAYSLLKTGNDQFGNHLPLSIAGFGDYRPALSIYATIPFVALFGLTEFAVRLPSALVSAATIPLVYLVIYLLTRKQKIALVGMILFSISPWSLYFGRMAHETNLMTFLILLGITFFLRFYKKSFLLAGITAVVLFSSALYTYHTARIFVPIAFLGSALIYWKTVRAKWREILICSVIFVICVLPLISEFQGEALSRVRGISIWNDPGLLAQINEQRGAALNNGMPIFLAKIIFSKLTLLPLRFTSNFLTHFSSDFLLTRGDPNGIYNVPNTGILLWIEPLLVVIGFIYIWQQKRELFWWLLILLFAALIPDSLTRVVPSSARIHVALPFVVLLDGVGLYAFVNFISTRTRKLALIYIVKFTFILLVAINAGWFWQNYLITLPVQNARAWQIGVKEMVLQTQALAPQYQKIWMSRECWGWIHVVFHTRFDPREFQKTATHSGRNDAGFWWVSDFGKFHLDWFPAGYQFNEPDTLYVGIPQEFPADTKPLEVIKHPITQEELYWFVSGSSKIGRS
ncbi:MAG: hypothetical protein UV59_C0004G0006 [Candidatus Gottesmanbacteria bacterium GW2011_GWA1_43_11]|uniref:Glycosyltransferase RgtA/B/C/D-like domain-containing protein n=1 Tax=Candidatus Gottesmanbacteria bacterium GW2011_GWA1_43_11 TaxID=1618436 RepID=A0A0G1FG78_9BACT|nr:MAG: hypothetical protein UV59_C0004G0006 [Candidatus Gottesmanbacteria bacterium GW2011_GWA1_43_11]